MKYKRIAIFTKTKWDESPRIRHQLTKLFLSYGHEVVFFEKSSLKQFKISKRFKDGILFIKHFEFLHHQLRPFKFLVKLNAFITKYLIKKAIKDEKIDLVINFNYDYYFLKEVFEEQKVVTIINDDFVSQGKFWMRNSIKNQLVETCENSDLVLAVSYPLVNQIKEYNANTHIFLPWAQNRYVKPNIPTSKKDVVLYWGYIDHRIDWDVIEYLLKKNVKLRFIGDVQSKIDYKIELCKKYENFELLPAMQLDKINIDDISCSILSYDTQIKALNAVTISNRAFQLLSYGIPLVYCNLPNLLKTKSNIITVCNNNEEYMIAINYFSTHFSGCQEDIMRFLDEHYEKSRYDYLIDKIEEITNDI